MHKLIVALLLLLLAGCAPLLPNPLALDPVTAQTAIEDQLRVTFPAQPSANVTVRRVERVPDGAVVLFAYETERDGVLITVLGVHQLVRQGLNWTSTGGAIFEPVAPATSPIDPAHPMTGYAQLGSIDVAPGVESKYTVDAGFVDDPLVEHVDVAFGDGLHERVAVENGTYVVERNGSEMIVSVGGLNAQGAVLHSVP